jgi:TetR/AcrR family transcriptional regulator, tetracycline repressor protein
MTGPGEQNAGLPRHRRVRPLTADDVVGAGVWLLDEGGLASFRMRSVAERLGTYPATVYWHVGNRAQLLARIVDKVLQEIVVPDAGLAWQEWLALLAREYRRVMHRHPQVAGLVAAQLLVSPPGMRPGRDRPGRAGGGGHGRAWAGMRWLVPLTPTPGR